MVKNYTLDDEMVTLAAITYRGFDLPLPEGLKRPLMYRAMSKCLATLGPVIPSRWEIIWGPVSHPDGSLKIDDAAIFVARSLANPNKLVIAVRGTNPISLKDWISEDFAVTKMALWPYNQTGGKVSASTLYGLHLLQSLHAKPRTETSPPKQHDLLAQIGDAIVHPASLVSIVNEARDKEAGGVTLIELLAALIAERAAKASPKLQIYVTGHSKGGTLSSTLALWLADTQSGAAGNWSNKDEAEIIAYSFAGPTAGDAAFAEHSKNVFGSRCHRIYNAYDIAPMAWSDLKGIPSLYGAPGDWPGVLLIDPIAAKVEGLGYHQIEVGQKLTPPVRPAKPSPWQIIYQHLDGYLEAMGLLDEMSAVRTFLNPIPF
ncbi:MAG: hypothetical protein ABSG46_10785 [Candidatus Binataceae bacterium]|jgi:hypothetical protein